MVQPITVGNYDRDAGTTLDNKVDIHFGGEVEGDHYIVRAEDIDWGSAKLPPTRAWRVFQYYPSTMTARACHEDDPAVLAAILTQMEMVENAKLDLPY